jgi:hypothetical protein
VIKVAKAKVEKGFRVGRFLVPYKMRDVDFLKPARFKDYVTISELSRIVGKDITWLRRLEREGRIPTASRVTRGELEVRLWSPAQVDEIKHILSLMRVGRPKGG